MNWNEISTVITRVYCNPTHLGNMDTVTWARAFKAVGAMKLTVDELAQRETEMSVRDCGYVDPIDFDGKLSIGEAS